MQSVQEPRRDDFDMAKLKKSLKQQQQRSTRSQGTVMKLTPAEIRSLNNSIEAAKAAGSTSRSSRSSKASTNTPPLTPDANLPQQRQSSRRKSASLPTPPQSPEDAFPQRQNSAAGSGVQVHSPIPQSHPKAEVVLATSNSRPHSASSHRINPTYRGSEVTRNGSFSRLQASTLTSQIVDNPLSQFSRPRQPRSSVSSTLQEQSRLTSTAHEDLPPERSPLPPVPRNLSTRSISPPVPGRTTDSPVSALDDETSMENADLPGPAESAELTEHTEPAEPAKTLEPDLDRVQTIAADGPVPLKPHSRFSWHWRKSLANPRPQNAPVVGPKKLRRRTLSGSRGTDEDVQSVAYTTTKSGATPQQRETLRGDLPSNRTSVYDNSKASSSTNSTDFVTHPAVRPLSVQMERKPDETVKGKEKERPMVDNPLQFHDVYTDDSIPVYSLCSCCGKLKKPNGTRSLSPVFENENIITNFSMEIERTDNDGSGRRRSSSANRHRFTPIIPMMMAEGNTVQAKIAPRPHESSQISLPEPRAIINKRGDIIASGSDPIISPGDFSTERHKNPVRFSSLHIKKANAQRFEQRRRGMNKDITSMGPGTRSSLPARLDGEEPDWQALYNAESSRVNDHHVTNRKSMPFENGIYRTPTPEQEMGEPPGLMGKLGKIGGGAIKSNETKVSNDTHDYRRSDIQIYNGQVEQYYIAGPGMALTTDEVTPPLTRRIISDTSEGDLRFVPYEPSPPEQRPQSRGKPPRSTYERQQSNDKSSNPKQDGRHASSSYVNFSTKNFSTNPKGTAQYMYGNGANVYETRPATPQEKEQTLFPQQKPAISEQMVPKMKTKSNVISRKPLNRTYVSASQNTTSPQNTLEMESTLGYDPLPPPQLGQRFSTSTTTFGEFDLMPAPPVRPTNQLGNRTHSNLVESVLAATSTDYDNYGDDGKAARL